MTLSAQDVSFLGMKFIIDAGFASLICHTKKDLVWQYIFLILKAIDAGAGVQRPSFLIGETYLEFDNSGFN